MPPARLDPLSRLAVRCGSDKFGGHLYTPIYHKLFSERREQPLRLLEIGVGGYTDPRAGGSSLRMWAEYFPYARIVGLDLSAKQLDISPRVTIVQGSQTDHDLLSSINERHGPFDIVIDDGSHVVSHMIDSLRYIYPMQPAGSTYVVEDTQTSFGAPTGGNPAGDETIFTLAHDVALGMHRKEGYRSGRGTAEILGIADMTRNVSIFRNMIVFERGDNRYPSNMALDLADPQVREVYASIEQEGANSPSSRSTLSRIDMEIWAGRRARAAELALQAAATYPSDPALLAELVRMMRWAEQHDAQAHLAARLDRLDRRAASPPAFQ